MVCLDEDGAVVRDALLWNDVRSAGAAADLITELGDGDEAAGRQAWADAVGVVPVASFTATKLRWLADAEPANADRTAAVCLPHDWLTWRLSADPEPGLPRHRPGRRQRHRLLVGAHRRVPARPARTRHARAPAGRSPRRRTGRDGRAPSAARTAVLGPGTGDNAAAALGLAARPGDVIVSIGTSGVVSAVTTTAVADVTGTVAGFADATGHHLPAGRHPERRPRARRRGGTARRRPRDPLRPRAVGPLGRRRPGAGPLPRGRADAEPAPGHRRRPRAHAPHVHPGPLGAGGGRGPALRARRRDRRRRRPGGDGRAGAADRWRRRLPRGAAARAGDLRPPASSSLARASTSPTGPRARRPGCSPGPARRRTGPSPACSRSSPPPTPAVRERYAEVRGRTDGQ